MAASCIVTVRAAIVEGLKAEDGLDKVEIDLGWKSGSSARERIFTRGSTFDLPPAGLKPGRNFRNEKGRFQIVIVVEGVAQDALWTSTRALELGQVVEEFIADRKNNELQVPGLQTLYMTDSGSITEMFADTGSLTELVYPVTYTARLT